MPRRNARKGTGRTVVAQSAYSQQAKSSTRQGRGGDERQSDGPADRTPNAERAAQRKAAREINAKLESGTWLTRDAATRVSSLSLRTLERAIVDGTLPAYRVRRRILIKAEDLQRFVERVAV